MLRPNNPEIDFDNLNQRIKTQLENYQASHTFTPTPDFDPSPLGQTPPSEAPIPEPVRMKQALPESIAQLMTLEGHDFIEQAYLLLLGRPADTEGLNNYLTQLRNGEEKANILAALRYSPEGAAQPGATSELHNTARKQRLRQLPVIGSLLSFGFSLLRLPQIIRSLNSRLTRLAADQTHPGSLRYQQQLNQLTSVARRTAFDLEEQIKLRDDQVYNLAIQAKMLSEHNQQLEQRINEQDQQLTEQRQQQQQQIAQLKLRLNAQPTPAAGTQPCTKSTPASGSDTPAIEDAFYLAFENHFRGDAATIQARLSYYLPLLASLPLVKQLPVADIGCGRGEWLDLLKEQGYSPIGIDMNSHNVAVCQQKGHKATQLDGLEWLTQQPANSLSALTSFHVIEHLTFEQYNQLLCEAMRVLAPGGLLILETPNPENLISGITHFYTDPTHLKPVPPTLSEFMLDYRGFTDIQIHRLHPIPDEFALIEHGDVEKHANKLFYGPQDYAVTGQKPLSQNEEPAA